MPVEFILPSPDDEDGLLEMDYFSSEYSLETVAKDIKSRLTSTPGIHSLTDLFLSLDHIEKEEYGRLYLDLLNAINKACPDILDEKLATELKVIIDFKKLGQRLAALKGNQDHAYIKSILALEKAITEKIDGYIAEETLRKDEELKLKFNELNLANERYQPYPFKNFPMTEIWRLYVDGRVQKLPSEQGWMGYEKREKNCINAMHKAFLYTLDHIEEPLSVSYLSTLHVLTANEVKEIQSGLRGNDVVTVKPMAYSLLGLDEYLKDNALRELQEYAKGTFTIRSRRVLEIIPKCHSNEDIEKIFATLIDNYTIRLKEAGADRFLQFKAIIRLSTDLTRFHPFKDGNCRTFVNLLLNRELIKYGFPPVILENPNDFDNFSQTELGIETLHGMENFKFVQENKIYPGAPQSLLTEAIVKAISAINEKASEALQVTTKPTSLGFLHQPIPQKKKPLHTALFKLPVPDGTEKGSLAYQLRK